MSVGLVVVVVVAAAASLIEYINHACVCIHRQITDSFAEAKPFAR